MAEPPAKVVALDASWPAQPPRQRPGDFSRYIPHGMALGAPMIVRPSDDPLAVISGPNYYGLEALEHDPVRAAPTQYPDGGVIYFDESSRERLETALSVMGVLLRETKYAVIQGSAGNPLQERYLDQVRIVSRGALGHLFGISGEAVAQVPAQQPITIGDYIQQFIAEQDAKWSRHDLDRAGGGDGDWAKGRLAFGFMVENGYWSVYRLWSRAWLITK
jgi:hypothetical protein